MTEVVAQNGHDATAPRTASLLSANHGAGLSAGSGAGRRATGRSTMTVSLVIPVRNEARNVVGLMPHPERASHELLGSTDGVPLLQSLLDAARGEPLTRAATMAKSAAAATPTGRGS